MEHEEKLHELAASQEGLVARFHLPQFGLSREHWRWLKASDRWDVLSQRVLAARGSPPSDARRVLAAVLDASPGAVLHGRSALAWFGMRGFNLREVQVARPYRLSGNPAVLGRLHRLRDLRPHHMIVVRGVPTESPLRAIWVEAARYSNESLFELGCERIGRLLDDAHRDGLVTWEALHEMVGDIRKRGRSGSAVMSTLADARLPGSSSTESRLEDRFEVVLGGRIPPLRRQVGVGGDEAVGRVDFRDPDLPLAVEVNSLTFHSTPSDRAADELRYRRLCDAGFAVAVVWEDDLWARMSAVVRAVADARSLARRGEVGVIHTPSCPWPGVTLAV